MCATHNINSQWGSVLNTLRTTRGLQTLTYWQMGVHTGWSRVAPLTLSMPSWAMGLVQTWKCYPMAWQRLLTTLSMAAYKAITIGSQLWLSSMCMVCKQFPTSSSALAGFILCSKYSTRAQNKSGLLHAQRPSTGNMGILAQHVHFGFSPQKHLRESYVTALHTPHCTWPFFDHIDSCYNDTRIASMLLARHSFQLRNNT